MAAVTYCYRCDIEKELNIQTWCFTTKEEGLEFIISKIVSYVHLQELFNLDDDDIIKLLKMKELRTYISLGKPIYWLDHEDESIYILHEIEDSVNIHKSEGKNLDEFKN